MDRQEPRRVLVAGSTGYLGKFAVRAFKQRGYWVRALTRSESRLRERGPFTAPAITEGDVDDVFVGEVTQPETLVGALEGIDCVFSSVGISRQRDNLTFEQVDYQANRNLIDLCAGSTVKKFVYVSMLGEDQIADLAITRAHERVVSDLAESGIDHTIVRPSGYFSDMGAVLGMAKRGFVLIVGSGENRFNPIHGRDLAEACVDAMGSEGRLLEAGGPEVLTQRDVAILAFDMVGKPVRLWTVPLWLARGLTRGIGMLNTQFGDLAEFIVTAGEVDAVAPPVGTTALRGYFERLLAGDPDA